MRLLATLAIGLLAASAGAGEGGAAAGPGGIADRGFDRGAGGEPDRLHKRHRCPTRSIPAAPAGSVQRYGDTAAQTRSILRKIEAQLKQHGMGLGDIVMMRVFLVAPPGQARMDFAGMMTAYREFFGTAAQPNKPARSTLQAAGLVDPGWLVEIEATAARAEGKGR